MEDQINSRPFTPSPTLAFTRNVALDLVLTLFLCGTWNLFVQYKQIQALNYLLKEERYVFWKIYALSLLTCGIYYVYHKYCKARDLAAILKIEENGEVVLAVVLTVIGLPFIYDAIFQDKLNSYFAHTQ